MSTHMNITRTTQRSLVRRIVHASGLNKIGVFRTYTDALKRFVAETHIPWPVKIQGFFYKGVSIEDYYSGSYEKETTALFKRLITPGMVILDIGAQRGYFTLLSSKLSGNSGRVYAFEPFAPVFTELRQNVERNSGSENIVLVQKGAGAVTKSQSYFIPSASIFPVKHEDVHADSHLVSTIDIVRLDDYFRDMISPIDFVKIDIEGAELQALDGMQEIIRRNPSLVLVIEIAPKVLDKIHVDPMVLLDKLSSFGFNLHTIQYDGTTERSTKNAILTMARRNRYINILCTH